MFSYDDACNQIYSIYTMNVNKANKWNVIFEFLPQHNIISLVCDNKKVDMITLVIFYA